MEKFQINVIKLKYPKKKKDRKGKTIEDYLAEYFRKKGYKVFFSRNSDVHKLNGLDYGTFLKKYPEFLSTEKDFMEREIDRHIKWIKENDNTHKKPSIWINGKQLTWNELQKIVDKRIKRFKGTIMDSSVREEINKKFCKIYENFKKNFPKESKALRKISLKNGKPDLFIYNNKEFFFCEVKSHNDGFHKNQVEWFLEHTDFPYRLVFVTDS